MVVKEVNNIFGVTFQGHYTRLFVERISEVFTAPKQCRDAKGDVDCTFMKEKFKEFQIRKGSVSSKGCTCLERFDTFRVGNPKQKHYA